ncbi:amidase [Hypericibacter adhaerens]|uniref:Amidase n=1 Tax=Hypericibacter adhaerens TaxID=2602016 RepID=A0A5J6N7M6_9PROT|nr:amidase family protein [Hypericibacter adhaerens]QEX23116.1 amidase [Hypericibacter adhaerens]
MSASDSDLLYISGTEALAAFKARKLSPVELMRAMIARAEAVNPKLNAITLPYYEQALAGAKEAERRYMGKGEGPRALEGLPLASKDMSHIAGEPVSMGSWSYEAYRSDHTSPTIGRLIAAGALVHMRTTAPEMGFSGITRSPRYGISRNPWNLDFTPGGSSGGSAAAVAAGMTVISDGSDGGGSIRIPASACGLVGYKAPAGRNPNDRSLPLEPLITTGPITRTVADAALMQNVVSGPHTDDLLSLREKVVLPEKYPSIAGCRVAYSPDLGYYGVEESVARNTKAALEVFRGLGCTVEEVKVPWTTANLDCWKIYWEALYAALMKDMMPQWRDRIDPFVVGIVERGLKRSGVEVYETTLHRGAMYQGIVPFLEKYDVLVCPTLAVPSMPVTHSETDPNFKIAGKPADPYCGWFMTSPFNLLGQLPVITVPSGIGSHGVPTGIQIVGRSYDDANVFRFAAAFEQAAPWRGRRPAL